MSTVTLGECLFFPSELAGLVTLTDSLKRVTIFPCELAQVVTKVVIFSSPKPVTFFCTLHQAVVMESPEQKSMDHTLLKELTHSLARAEPGISWEAVKKVVHQYCPSLAAQYKGKARNLRETVKYQLGKTAQGFTTKERSHEPKYGKPKTLHPKVQKSFLKLHKGQTTHLYFAYLPNLPSVSKFPF